jgi:hypothetical protein
MATLRNNERVAGITNPEWAGQDFDSSDPNQTTAQRLNTYLVDCLETYENGNYLDDILFDNLKDDFAEWTEDHFKTTDKTLRTTLKNYLKDHGVFVGNEGTVSKQLASTIQHDEYPKWPEKEAQKYRETRRKKFQSYRNNPGFDKPGIEPNSEQEVPVEKEKLSKRDKPATTTRKSASKETARKAMKSSKRAAADPDDDDGSDSSSSSDSDNNDDSLVDPVNLTNNGGITPAPAFGMTTSKVLTDLSKLYCDNSKKFGGDLYDILDAKIKIFRDLCNKAGVLPNLYHDAYSTMLKDRAEQFYYDHLAERNLRFDEMVRQTKEFFHTVENRQLYLQEWRSTTYQRVIQSNPEKDLSQCLEIVIDKLQKIHKRLSSNYQADYNLAEQLINACQGVEACTPVLMKPAASFESVASDLRSAVGIHMRCKREVSKQYNTAYDDYYEADDTGYDQYWVDRRYEGGRPRGRGGFRGGSRDGFRGGSRGSYDNNGHRNNNTNKKCFVCGKPGCWSTKHPLSERRPRQNHWRRFMQEHGQNDTDFASFLIDYEGVDTGDFETETTHEFDSWFT